MSKKSQKEARQKKEESEQQRRSEFLETLDVYLKMFAESLPRNKDLGAMTDYSVTAFDIGLKDLSPRELKIGCEEILKFNTFFPAPAEVREALENYRKRETAGWGTAVSYPEQPEWTAEEKAEMKKTWDDAWKKIGQIGKKAKLPEVPAWDREPGLD